MYWHHRIARKTSNTVGSAARSCGSCWSFPNIRLVARGVAANQYAIALLELTFAVSGPVQNAVSPLPHASRLFSFTNKMRSHQPVSHCLWHAIIEIAFLQSQRVSSPLTENEPGEEIDGVAPIDVVITSELALLDAGVNGVVFRTISLLVIWTAWKACAAMMSVRKVTEEQGMADIGRFITRN